MPRNTIKVDRSTRWGNPFKVGETATHPVTGKRLRVSSRDQAISLYRAFLKSPKGKEVAMLAGQMLKGKNLACWCKPDQSCHADALLELANHAKTTRHAA